MLEANQTIDAATREPLMKRMLERGWEFDFFKAVWNLERYATDRTPIGGRGPVSQEAIRLRPEVSMGFPATDVRRIARRDDPTGGPPFYRIDLTFMGLYGVSTPLPLHYAVDILRLVAGQSAESPAEGSDTADRGAVGTSDPEAECAPARDFLDLLHHRLLSLFYRAWTKYRYEVSFGHPGRDEVTTYLTYLIGGSPTHGEDELGVPPVRLLRYAGILTQHPKSAVAIQGMLRDYWGNVPIDIDQFVGRWVTLAPDDMNAIGVANSRPGENLILGQQVYDLSGAFNVAIGPVDWETYLDFLPDGERFAQTRSLVRLAYSDPLAFTLRIRLKAGVVPEVQLYSDHRAARLGYTSWVRTDQLPETSVTFDAESAPPPESAATPVSKEYAAVQRVPAG
jgi:type VI secretion system protein ImpH